MVQITLFQKRKDFFLSALFLGIIFFSFSCKKPEDQIGSEVQPSDGKLNFEQTDTISLFAYSKFQDDSLITGGSLTKLKTGILGSLLDPVFGYTGSEIYTQLGLGEIAPVFGEDPLKLVVDSVILSLKYFPEFYGGINSNQFVIVNELAEAFNDSSVYYYSNDSLLANSENLIISGKEIVSFNPNRKVDVGPDTAQTPHLRVFLQNSFGEKIIKASADKLVDQEKFREFVKGLKISAIDPNPGQGNGGLFRFDLKDDTSKITIHYRDLAVSDTIPKVYKLIIGESNSRKFFRIKHDYTNSEVGSDISLGPLVNREKVYIQSLAGVKSMFKIPHLDQLKDKNIAINKAELVFNVLVTDNEKYAPSTRLGFYAFLNDTSEIDYLIYDFDVDPSGGLPALPYSYKNGLYNEETKQYRLNLTHHIQQILSGYTDNHGFTIETRSALGESNRSIIYGPAHFDLSKRMRLELTYTTYNP